MVKEEYLKIVEEKSDNKVVRDIMKQQIDRYYEAKSFAISEHKYKIGDIVFLKKGTLLHGTYKNLDGL